ncbi:MAG: helix-turn-helix domain-containing protein, partial [bacterium]
RDRREDIPLLATSFAEEICQRYGMVRKKFSADALQKLKSMDWSGNVRELRNIVERLVIMTPSATIEAGDIEQNSGGVKTGIDDLLGLGATFQDFKDKAESAYIKKMLDEHHWNISKTAEALDIQRSHLYNKMKKFGLARGDEKEE